MCLPVQTARLLFRRGHGWLSMIKKAWTWQKQRNNWAQLACRCSPLGNDHAQWWSVALCPNDEVKVRLRAKSSGQKIALIDQVLIRYMRARSLIGIRCTCGLWRGFTLHAGLCTQYRINVSAFTDAYCISTIVTVHCRLCEKISPFLGNCSDFAASLGANLACNNLSHAVSPICRLCSQILCPVHTYISISLKFLYNFNGQGVLHFVTPA